MFLHLIRKYSRISVSYDRIVPGKYDLLSCAGLNLCTDLRIASQCKIPANIFVLFLPQGHLKASVMGRAHNMHNKEQQSISLSGVMDQRVSFRFWFEFGHVEA